jgi:tetratricopeptide (TPR) repeat protein
MANYYLGVALTSAGKYDDAVPHFSKLINDHDNHVSAHYHLGRVYMKTFKYEKAKNEFKHVLELDPDNQNAAEMYAYITDDHSF